MGLRSGATCDIMRENIVVLRRSVNYPERETNLLGGSSMTTLPPHAAHDNPIPTTSGIYKITCLANKRIYIGSTFNLQQRKSQHFSDLRLNKHCNRHLQRAWDKYGEHAFTFEVLELVLSMSLPAREQYWLNKLKPFGKSGFNIAREAHSNLGVERSPETIEKLRQAKLGKKQSPEMIEARRQGLLGHEVSGEARKKSSTTQQGRPSPLRGRKQSPEHIENNRQARLRKKNGGGLGNEFS